MPYPDVLEGCALKKDVHQPLGKPSYERFYLKCNIHHNCKKYRACEHRDTRHLGPRASLAFLACWARSARPDRNPAHTIPTIAQMREWLEANPE